MHDSTEAIDLLAIHSLRDACGIGLGLAEDFGPEPFCAVWLGYDDGTMADFVVLAEERGRDIESLVECARLAARLLPLADRVVLFQGDGDIDIDDTPALANRFFDHRDRLAAVGHTLVDEIVINHDDIRSLAITTFSDEPEWDDLTALLDLEGGE